MKRTLALVLTLAVLWMPLCASAAAVRRGMLSLSDAVAFPHKEIRLPVVLKENPSLASVTLEVEYDAPLQLLSVENGEVMPLLGESASLSSPFRVTLVDYGTEPSQKTGALFYLVIKFDENTPVGTEAALRITAVDARDFDGFRVEFDPVCAKVTAVEQSNADVTQDGLVTSADAIYLLYFVLFGAERYPVSGSPDFNSDGIATSADAIYLLYHVLFGQDRYPV